MTTKKQSGVETRTKLLDAGIAVIRSKGYAATTVDDVCETAAVTKGSFFHHFKSKEALAVAAAENFSAMADSLFSNAAYQAAADPLERLLGYVDFRIELLQGSVSQFTCLLGTMVQETYHTHPVIRQACDEHLSAHADMLTEMIAEAKKRYAPKASWTPENMGLFMQAQIQGAFILAKAKQNPEVVITCLQQLRHHLETFFNRK
jgi:TetR/AcrR family transcriptional repressor of nem operon